MTKLRTLDCPVQGCDGKRHANEILCKRHWFRLPLRLRQEIWRAFKAGPGSEYHDRLVTKAIDDLQPKRSA